MNFEGNSLGNLTILKKLPKGDFLCRCICGKEKTLKERSVVVRKRLFDRGKLNSEKCHCVKIRGGDKFGDLTVTGKTKVISPRNKNRVIWEAKCSCGKFIWTIQAKLLSGRTNNCGCKYLAHLRESRIKKGLQQPTKLDSKIHRSFNRYKKLDAQKGRIFSMEYVQFKKMVLSPCHWCGEIINGDKIHGIDRVDSSKGHVPENCVPSCALCNRKKLNSSEKDFLAWVIRVAQHQINLGNKDFKVLGARDV